MNEYETLYFKMCFSGGKVFFLAYHNDKRLEEVECTNTDAIDLEFYLFVNKHKDWFIQEKKKEALFKYVTNQSKLKLSTLYGEMLQDGEQDATDET